MQTLIKNSQRGFTLIELMIVVVIIGVLAGIALPSYQQYLIKGNRAAAKAQMMDVANRQQQFLLSDREYADMAKLNESGYVLPPEVSAKYALTMDVGNDATPPNFTITMTPRGSQAADGVLTLNAAGVKTPADKW